MLTNITKKVYSLLFITMTATLSCKRSAYTSNPIAYCENPKNGLFQLAKRNGIVYQIQYKPRLFILNQEQQTSDASTYEQRKKDLEGMLWFNITLRAEKSKESVLRYKIHSYNDYVQRLAYYLNDAREDIKLEYDDQILAPISYWFENNQNLTSHETIVVGFELPAGNTVPSSDLKLSFRDRAFENGIIKIQFNKDDLDVVSGL